jgi:hypothetical protein
MFARIGVMWALSRRVQRVFNPDRKDHRWESGSLGAIGDPSFAVPELTCIACIQLNE